MVYNSYSVLQHRKLLQIGSKLEQENQLSLTYRASASALAARDLSDLTTLKYF